MSDAAEPRLSVNDRLDRVRRERFVGREGHRATFQSMLRGDPGAPALLSIYGPGGIGKSTLIECLMRDARDRGVTTIKIDGRTTPASPEAIERVLLRELGLPPDGNVFDHLGRQERVALFIDTYEYLNPVDSWIHDELIASLPENVSTVIAGRNPPPPERRSDSGWSAVAVFVQLRNLEPDDSRRFLELRNVPAADHERVLNFTHGYPLALSMVADIFVREGGSVDEIEIDEPDLVHTLVERLMRDEHDRGRLRALEVAAQARFTTVDLLSSVLDDGRADEHFQWLDSLSFIERGPLGLFPHDMARDAIERDLRWRSPDQALSDHQKIREWYVGIIDRGTPSEQLLASFDLLYLHRTQPAMRPLVEWSVNSSAWLEPATADDLDYCRRLAHATQGPTSARVVDYWFERQPDSFSIVMTGGKRRLGFLAAVDLNEDRSDAQYDPAAAAIWDWVDRHQPLRPGEQVRVGRFQTPDGLDSLDKFHGTVAIWSLMDWLTTPRACWSFVVTHYPEMLGESLEYGRFEVCGEDVTAFERPARIYGHDWRSEPRGPWLELMSQKELGRGDPQPPADSPPLLVLSETEFRSAVRDALRSINRPGKLVGNPLLQSRLLRQTGNPTPAGLQALVREAATSLNSEPRDRRFALALERAYLHPAESHEQAAESLGLPYSTFRLHLTTAVQRVVDYLWDLELRSG